jgi:hypothetical protein
VGRCRPQPGVWRAEVTSLKGGGGDPGAPGDPEVPAPPPGCCEPSAEEVG